MPTCIACLENVPLVELDCGHGSCAECWRRYIMNRVTDGEVNIGCMFLDCDETLSEDRVLEFLQDNDQASARYLRFLEMKRLESDPNMRWCINPKCGKPVFGFRVLQKMAFWQKARHRLAVFAVPLLWAGLCGYVWYLLETPISDGHSFCAPPPRRSKRAAFLWTRDEVLAAIGYLAAPAIQSLEAAESHWGLVKWACEYIPLLVSFRGLSIAGCTVAAAVGMRRAMQLCKVTEEPKDVRSSTCTECGTSACFECKNPVHPGSECSTVIDSEFKSWVDNRSETLRAPCHGCGSVIELRDGCNHVTCICCGYQFCMLCGEPIAGKVTAHYSRGPCTRYTGEMTPSWASRYWDFGSSPATFTLHQMSQLSLPCIIGLFALAGTSLLRGQQRVASDFLSTWCTPEAVAVTSMALTVASVSHSVNTALQTPPSVKPQEPPLWTRVVKKRERTQTQVFFSAWRDVLAPQLAAGGVYCMRVLLQQIDLNPSAADVSADFGAADNLTAQRGVLSFLVSTGSVVVDLAIVLLCTAGTVSFAALPHYSHSFGAPKAVRPFLDCQVVVLLYTAAFNNMHSGSTYATVYTSLLCFSVFFYGLWAFPDKNEAMARDGFRHRGFPSFIWSWCGLYVGAPVLWSMYIRASQVLCVVWVIVLLDATLSLWGVLYCVLCVIVAVTPTSYKRQIPEATFAGWAHASSLRCKNGWRGRVFALLSSTLLLELIFTDAVTGGAVLQLVEKVLITNITPIAFLSWKQHYWAS
ncbi:hypothetical protein DIPPA_13592 [Diplonema papillatum]|nr:hypothetical protein DIPPA_13592 [Diplonema papillatum]